MNAIVPAETAVRAFQQAAMLRHVGPDGFTDSIGELARQLGRDRSNTRKSLEALEADDLITRFDDGGLELTETGRRMLQALDVAEGKAEVGGGAAELLWLQHWQIKPNPLNPRTEFDEDGLGELADSIAAVDQIIVPLIVFPPDDTGARLLAAGERRWRAVAKLMKDGRWNEHRYLPCIERENDPGQAVLIGLIENGQRVDLNLWDQAQAYVALMDAMKLSARQVALKTGKSPRAVQEAVQVVKTAKAEDGADYKAGKITWEELRTGVRRPVERPAPEVELQQTLALSGPATLATAPAAQVDLEELAPRKLDLTPKQILVLHEVRDLVERKPKKKAEHGPTAEITRSPDLSNPANLDVTRLVADGLLLIRDVHPRTVTLTAAGQAWLASEAGNFMDGEFKLRRARRDAGLSDEKIAELVADETYATEWLNGYRAPRHEPLQPADALIVLEMMDAKAAQGGPGYYGPKVRGRISEEQLQDLRQRGVLARQDGPSHDDGIRRASWGWEAGQAVEQQCRGLDDTKRRREHLAALREQLGLPAQKARHYTTDWLNGPFEPDPQWVREREEAKERQARAEESRVALEAARASLHEQFAAFEAELPTLSLEQASQRVAAWLGAVNAPAPWIVIDDDYQFSARASNGAGIALGRNGGLSRRLALMAVNIVAGVPPAEWTTSGHLTREAFEARIVDMVLEAVAEGAPEIDLTPEAAKAKATAAVNEMLDREGIAFGDDAWDWTAAGVDGFASDILGDLEQAGEQ